MRYKAEEQIKAELRKIMGVNCEPTAELEKMLLAAYSKGFDDAYGSLGLDEDDFQSGDGLMAWTA